MSISTRNGLKLLIFSLLLLTTHGSFSQTAEESFLNDLIYLWNNHKYEKVYQPLKDFKASKNIKNDFEVDYMIGTSACRSGLADGGDLMGALEKDYNLKKEDVDYIEKQRTECKKYVRGAFPRVDAERISARGKSDEPTSAEVPKPTKAPKAEPATTPTPDPVASTPEPEPTKPTKEKASTQDAGPKVQEEITRKPNVTQIVKGDKVITVKGGWSYYVRQDSIYAIPPSKAAGTKVSTGAPIKK